MLNNSESIKEEILRYFEKLYASPSREPWRVEGLDWSPISGESASRLESPFTEEEISKAIFQLDRDKAPGSDGFTIAVFQDCWEVIKEDLVRVFAEFHRSGIINQSTNTSFIVLTSKRVLHETIHSTQGAFVQGRQILDAVLIANEIVDEKRRSGEEGVVFKIDFEKAYDHVILVIGNAKEWVKASRGLRQGDPLSSFLFTIVADVLSRMLLRAEERNVFEGFRVGRNRTRVSHLQFADDTIFFSSTREEDMMTLKNVLLVFGHISGLKVNLDKSNIYGINLEQNHLSRLVEMLDCKASRWPILYLCLPLGGNPKACGFWDPVIERISKILDGWQKAYLSFGGRITLIQSCLTHMPCFLSLFKIPASVATKIERLQRDFLWSGVGEGKRDHLDFSQSNIFFLALSQYSDSPPVFPTKFVWNSQVLFKVKSFVCSLMMGLWHRLFQLAKTDWVPPRSISDMLSTNFNGFGSSKRGIVLWQDACIALMWVVWQERNARIFYDKVRNSEYLWDSIRFLASLLAFCSKVFKGIPLNVLQLDWLAVCNPNGLV
ncbi:LINE-1 retrotransposable element ORF2 protein [Vitis vinifera]|uniref:LINE-1 retrotransposable element ORF2 protein n=1 Tax=Vitis vinifera TaxID=29760 RepID=A0A438KMP6_VITVI|nr:LINE-1 retrotransposable element ORF2 protein [Vitis vinifera]